MVVEEFVVVSDETSGVREAMFSASQNSVNSKLSKVCVLHVVSSSEAGTIQHICHPLNDLIIYTTNHSSVCLFVSVPYYPSTS